MDVIDAENPATETRTRRERGKRRDPSAKPLGVPYIIRNIPPYDIVSEEGIVRIEKTADRILAEIGIEFRDDPVAIDHWKRAGAKVDGLLVKFEPGMLQDGAEGDGVQRLR